MVELPQLIIRNKHQFYIAQDEPGNWKDILRQIIDSYNSICHHEQNVMEMRKGIKVQDILTIIKIISKM